MAASQFSTENSSIYLTFKDEKYTKTSTLHFKLYEFDS